MEPHQLHRKIDTFQLRIDMIEYGANFLVQYSSIQVRSAINIRLAEIFEFA